ncbi:MAG TPA: hypothetical protein VNT28_01765 [Candidatus Limnocylindrales bacterium]|jgi:hypothetical protein|nr:hypothetical protein [Candidatus Limnocylindrales bacterium]
MRVDFCGYSGDCTIHGQIDLPASRLSDALNREPQLVVHDVVLRSLEQPSEMSAGDQAFDIADLFAVEAPVPAGDEQRRIRTVRELLRVEAGPYVIYGEMHSLPGIGGLRTFHARRGMVPMTQCQAIFERHGRLEVVATPFLLVNSRLVDHVDVATPEQYGEEVETRAAAALGAKQQASDAVA